MRRTQIVSVLIAVMLLVCVAWAASAQNAAPPSNAGTAPAAKEGATDAAPAGDEIATPDVKPEDLPQIPEVKDAITKFSNRDFDGALAKLGEACKKNLDLPPPPVMLAQLFAQVNVPAGIRNSLERAVSEYPTDPEAYIIMSDLALRERRFTESRLLLEKADILMPSFSKSAKRKTALLPRIPSGLALTAQAREEWPAAQKYLEAWLKLEPNKIEALQQLAHAMFQQKNINGALEKLNEAAKIDKEINKDEKKRMETPEAVIGEWYERAKDRDNARKYFSAAIKTAPRDLNTRLAIAQWAWETKQYADAKNQAAAALQLDANSIEAKRLAALIAMFLKDYKSAEVYSSSALEQSPKDLPSSNTLALALAEQNDKTKAERALEYAEVNARAYPKNPEVLSTYGWVLYKLAKIAEESGKTEEKQRRMDAAEQVFQNVAKLGQFSADTAYYMALISLERERRDDAKKLLTMALENNGPFMNKKEATDLYQKIKN